ncbi:protein translocase, SecG subunit [Ruminococcaceae bacterium FB2012]|nr:protein translocase, SecG subunit [Ruminococcaceae bacterium FB2012]
MSTVEIVAGALLLVAALIIILVVLAQESKEQGLTSAIGGGANESFYEHNMGKTRDAKLSKFTRNAAIVLFIVTLAVNLFSTINRNKASDEDASDDAAVVSTVEDDTASTAAEAESTAEAAEAAESAAE